jgi:hypothetical protein
MSEPFLIPLFPDTLYIRELEIPEVDLSDIVYKDNIGNLVSVDHYILEQERFKDIKETVTRCVNEYFYAIMEATRETEIYITESWVNKTVKGQYHHQHTHNNSVISGVLFLEYDDADMSGKINFVSPKYHQVDFDVYNQNAYNGKGFVVTPKRGIILLFPSWLQHKVDAYKGDTPRISLSFNTFLSKVLSARPTQSLTLK